MQAAGSGFANLVMKASAQLWEDKFMAMRAKKGGNEVGLCLLYSSTSYFPSHKKWRLSLDGRHNSLQPRPLFARPATQSIPTSKAKKWPKHTSD